MAGEPDETDSDSRQIAAQSGRREQGERARCGHPWARRTSPLEQTHPGWGSESPCRWNAGARSRNDARGCEQVPIVHGHALPVKKRFARNRPTRRQWRPQESIGSRRWIFSVSLPNQAQSASRSAVFQEQTPEGKFDDVPRIRFARNACGLLFLGGFFRGGVGIGRSQVVKRDDQNQNEQRQ